MVNISADGGKGGDGYNGGFGGQGGQGGAVRVIAGQINELAILVNVIQNNPTIIIQKFDEVIKQVENDKTLKAEQKSRTKFILESLRNILTTAEPYARPFISKALEALSASTQ